MQRCNKELFIEKYFGLIPEKTDEKTKIVTDFGQLVNLLTMFESDKLNQTEVSVLVAVQEILKPEYANSTFLWCQIKDAINKATER